MQTRPLTTANNKFISANLRSTKKRGEKKNWNHDKPKDKHNASRTNATCHAYPNSDQTAHINLRQVDISKTRDAKKGRSEKKVGTATSPSAPTTQAIQMQQFTHSSWARPVRTAQVGLREAGVGFLTRPLKVSCLFLPILGASWARYRMKDAHTRAPDCFIHSQCKGFEAFCLISRIHKFLIS